MKLNLLSLERIIAVFMLAICGYAMAKAADIHVATTGNDDNAGTEAAPLATIHKAMELVKAGDRILVHEGTYTISERIKIPELPTNADKRCELRAWPESAVGKVIIDGSAMNHTTQNEFKMGRCIYVNHLANYWTFYGLVLQNAEDNGMKVEGSYNIIERCTFRWNNDTGLQIGMFKDFAIEETKSFPISGQPQFNPGYTYCRYNKVINCDSYENADARTYNGSDDYGDADGFACKLFPGPGTEFHGCRAWTNSDDNWDLYMVYHPVVIDSCWAYNAGRTKDGKDVGNGNGFKLGGGGTSGGAAFDQSVGAHVVTNCVAFDNLKKGFDQNNAYEGMYILNCVGWGNAYNYRFSTEFKYGLMDIHNCVGWGAKEFNHEFLSSGPVHNTDYNSWTTIDGCEPIKDKKIKTKDYSGEFQSLSVADFQADREADGSLPNNGFARLKETSTVFKDKGMPIIGYTPTRKMTQSEAEAAGLELITADDIYIGYNDAAPEFGAFELPGVPYEFERPQPIELTCKTANSSQEVIAGSAIEPIVYEWNDVATSGVVTNLPAGLTSSIEGNTLTISGTPTAGGTFTVTASADATSPVKPRSTTGSIKVVTPFKVLTGDWYHFQDAWDALPADLQGVMELIGEATVYDPEYTEPKDGSIPAGCTQGGIDMAKSGGGIRWHFTDGVLQLKINLHFTGGRDYTIKWTNADNTSGQNSITGMTKGTYCEWDVIGNAGLTEDEAKNIRTIEILNTKSSGGARVYDQYIRVPLTETAISNVNANDNLNVNVPVKVVSGGRIVVLKNGVRYDILGRKL
ncbi:MAG: right-handed parallel beta-helix repeat-containing protein [Prevotella sp.]|nr:right-handed parallel beta-helix repeat-containing protein [Prevotella sp.]